RSSGRRSLVRAPPRGGPAGPARRGHPAPRGASPRGAGRAAGRSLRLPGPLPPRSAAHAALRPAAHLRPVRALGLAARGATLARPEHRPRGPCLRCSSVEDARSTPSSRLGLGRADGVPTTRELHHGLLAVAVEGSAPTQPARGQQQQPRRAERPALLVPRHAAAAAGLVAALRRAVAAAAVALTTTRGPRAARRISASLVDHAGPAAVAQRIPAGRVLATRGARGVGLLGHALRVAAVAVVEVAVVALLVARDLAVAAHGL